MVVLIVDDNPGVRRLLRMAVGERADDIQEAVDGVDGVERYAGLRPDIVLMDLRMPRMDGLTATRAILNIESRAKVIIVTDHDDDDIRVAVREAGACGFVPKQNLTGIAELVCSSVESQRTSIPDYQAPV